MKLMVHNKQIKCFREISTKHINKILDKSHFAEIVRHNFFRQCSMEAFGEDIGPRPVSILPQSSYLRSKSIKRMSSQSSHENKPKRSPNLR